MTNPSKVTDTSPVPVNKYLIRRAEHKDHNALLELADLDIDRKDIRVAFGSVNYNRLIETSVLCLVALEHESNEIVGFMAVNDSPEHHACPTSESYFDMLQSKYLPPRTLRTIDTFWLRYLIQSGARDRESQEQLLEQLLLSVYMTCPEINYIFASVPRAKEEFVMMLDPFFVSVLPKPAFFEDEQDENPICYSARNHMRRSSVHDLNIRMACVEDYDDLYPILNQQDESLQANFGTFYVADLIKSQNEHNKVLVSHSRGQASGLLCISDEVDPEVLQDHFELETYGNLTKTQRREVDPVAVAKLQHEHELEMKKKLNFKVVVLVPPVGKSQHPSLCAEVAQIFDLVHISIGDMLRSAVQAGTSAGLAVKPYLTTKESVPDELMIEILVDRLQKHDCATRGWLLDGFPRTEAQAQSMKLAGTLHPDVVLVLDVPSDELFIENRCARRIALLEDDKQEYHLTQNPPPPGVEVIQPDSDAPDVVRTQLEAFHQHAAVVVAQFQAPDSSSSSEDDNLSPSLDLVHLNFDQAKATELEKALDDRLNARGKGLEQLLQTSDTSTLSKNEAEVDVIPNAFLITLFCIDAVYESRSCDFLAHAFAAFPEKEYCVISFPPDMIEPFILHEFNLIPSKPGTTFSHVLYLLHREALFTPLYFRVERYAPEVHGSSTFIQRILKKNDDEKHQQIQQRLDASVAEAYVDLEDNPTNVTFVALIDAQVMGFATCSRESTLTMDQLSRLASQFHITDSAPVSYHRPCHHLTCENVYLNPHFLGSARRLFFKEIMRLMDKTCLHYRPSASSVGVRSITREVSTTFRDFVPLRPRRLSQQVMSVPETIGKSSTNNHTLFLLPKRLLSESKVHVNTRLVFVGASDTTLTCLKEVFLSSPHLLWSQITLISPHGLMLDANSSESLLTADFFPLESVPALSSSEFATVKPQVRVLKSKVVDLDRHTRAVSCDDGTLVPYDVLILATGLTSRVSRTLDLLPRYHVVENRVENPEIPQGLHLVTDVRLATTLHDAIIEGVEEDPQNFAVVVFGASVRALALVRGCIRRKCPQLTWVLPSMSIAPCFPVADLELILSVEESLVSANVELKYGWNLESIATTGYVHPKTKEPHTRVTCATFIPVKEQHANEKCQPQSVLELPCSVLCSGEQDDVDEDVFRAIQHSGLVFDGRLVVSPEFQTTDPRIYGAGSLSRFSRRHKVAPLEQYDTRESGRFLARALLRHVDPMIEVVSEEDKVLDTNLPQFEAPKAVSAILPGELYYTGILVPMMKPRKSMDLKSARMLVTRVTTTGTHLSREKERVNSSGFDDDEAGELIHHCTLFLNRLGYVQGLAYLGNEAIEVSNLMSLVGLHQSYLNSAVASYEANLVDDWIAFFRQGWAYALYDDGFQSVCRSIKSNLLRDEGMRTIVDKCKKTYKKTRQASKALQDANQLLGRGGSALLPTTKQTMEMHLLAFLHQNRDSLHMYCPRTTSKE